MMKKINIIIIGARNYDTTYDKNDITTWNNYNQADYNTLCELKKILSEKKYDISIICIDSCYDITFHNEYDITFHNEYYIIGDTKHLDINAHNIIIEFANLLNENFVSDLSKTQYNEITKYNPYKISWIACGCCWNIKFSIKMIQLIIDNNYYTPTDACSVNSFITAISFNNDIYKKNLLDIMQPFSQGVYQILGTLMWRGYEKDYSSENILIDLINLLKDIFIVLPNYTDVQKFINKEIHWNRLNRTTRLAYTKYIYGSNIKIDS